MHILEALKYYIRIMISKSISVGHRAEASMPGSYRAPVLGPCCSASIQNPAEVPGKVAERPRCWDLYHTWDTRTKSQAPGVGTAQSWPLRPCGKQASRQNTPLFPLPALLNYLSNKKNPF